MSSEAGSNRTGFPGGSTQSDSSSGAPSLRRCKELASEGPARARDDGTFCDAAVAILLRREPRRGYMDARLRIDGAAQDAEGGRQSLDGRKSAEHGARLAAGDHEGAAAGPKASRGQDSCSEEHLLRIASARPTTGIEPCPGLGYQQLHIGTAALARLEKAEGKRIRNLMSLTR